MVRKTMVVLAVAGMIAVLVLFGRYIQTRDTSLLWIIGALAVVNTSLMIAGAWKRDTAAEYYRRRAARVKAKKRDAAAQRLEEMMGG